MTKDIEVVTPEVMVEMMRDMNTYTRQGAVMIQFAGKTAMLNEEQVAEVSYVMSIKLTELLKDVTRARKGQ